MPGRHRAGQRRRTGRRLPAAGMAAGMAFLMAVTALLVPVGPAVRAGAAVLTSEVYPVPPGGVYRVDGHGFGHGIGMSQWGADGAAREGLSASQILGFYYPDTASATVAERVLRVLIAAAGDRALVVSAETGLQLHDAATGGTWSLPAAVGGLPVRLWRVTVASGGEQAAWSAGSGWQTMAFSGRTTFGGPLTFQGPPTVHLDLPDGSGRLYRGALAAVAAGGGTLAVVNRVPMEDYLYGVVPRESPASWPAAALQAQAVAARTYATYSALHAGGRAWDICDSDTCQVYMGAAYVAPDGAVTGLESQSTTAATDATRGVIRTYGGAPILAMFSASDGGWTVAGNEPYLPARADPYDALASPMHEWTAWLSAADLQRAFPAVGRLLRIVVTSRDGNGDWGGRVLAVTLQGLTGAGQPTSVQTTGAGVYFADPWPASATGLASSWWTVDPRSYPASYPGAAPAAMISSGRSYLFYASGGAEAVYRTRDSSTGWSAPVDLGRSILGGPTVTPTRAGTPDVFVVGPNGQLYQRQFNGTAWASWYGLGGAITAGPGAADFGPGLIAVAVRGLGGAGWVRLWSATSGWAPWTSLSGVLSAGAGPAVASPESGVADVFARGADGWLYERVYQAGQWSAHWQRLPVYLLGQPGAASPGGGVLVLAVVGTDGHTRLATSVDGGPWSSWVDLSGSCNSGDALATDGSHLDVYTRGPDGNLYVKTTTVTQWGSPSSWTWTTWQRAT